MCACPKRTYHTRALARTAITRIKAEGNHLVLPHRGRLRVYRCGEGWHIGHAPLQLVVEYRRKRAA